MSRLSFLRLLAWIGVLSGLASGPAAAGSLAAQTAVSVTVLDPAQARPDQPIVLASMAMVPVGATRGAPSGAEPASAHFEFRFRGPAWQAYAVDRRLEGAATGGLPALGARVMPAAGTDTLAASLPAGADLGGGPVILRLTVCYN